MMNQRNCGGNACFPFYRSAQNLTGINFRVIGLAARPASRECGVLEFFQSFPSKNNKTPVLVRFPKQKWLKNRTRARV
jgi:hypothetical protein